MRVVVIIVLIILSLTGFAQNEHVAKADSLLSRLDTLPSQRSLSFRAERWDWTNTQHDETWWETDASARGYDYLRRTGRFDPNAINDRFPWLTNQELYDFQNPRRLGKWWGIRNIAIYFSREILKKIESI